MRPQLGHIFSCSCSFSGKKFQNNWLASPIFGWRHPVLAILDPPLKILLKFTHITVDFDVVLQRFLGVEEFVADPALLYPLDPIFLLPMETHVLFEVVLELRREVTIRTPVNRKSVFKTLNHN